jgi:hypothetical protein
MPSDAEVERKQANSSALANTKPAPILRHSIGWSLATAALALTLDLYAVGGAYAGTASRLWIACMLAAAGALAVGGVAYIGLVLRRRPRSHTRLAVAPFAVALNLVGIVLAIVVAAAVRW